jgi:hypothetical protein
MHKNIKNLFAIFIIFFVIFTPVCFTNLIAQDLSVSEQEAIISDDPRVKLELIQQTQNPADGTIDFILKIDSKISSDRVRLTWRLNGQVNFAEDQKQTQALKLKENLIYQIPIKIIPIPFVRTTNDSGWRANELLAQIEVVLVEGNVVATARKNFATSYEGLALPITEEYKNALNAYTNMQTFLNIFLTLLVIGFILLAIKIFKKWVEKDERELFEKAGSVPLGFRQKIKRLFKKDVAKKSSEYEY